MNTGRRHTSIGVMTWPHSLIAWLPVPWALRLLALYVLQSRGELPKRGFWGTLAQGAAWTSAVRRDLEPGDVTFEFPPRSGLVWEVLDTRGHTRPFHGEL